MFRVLLPLDTDTERSRRATEAVASLPNATEEVAVTILNVHPKLEEIDETAAKPEEWYDENDFPDSVLKAKEILQGSGIQVETRREFADPVEAIMETATEIEADRIVMAGRKHTPVGKVLFGSVTQSVLLDSDTPVTVVGENGP
jgi:nucleotide-binding universal stress UspA family protein